MQTYKTVGDTKLNLYIYNPPGHKATDKSPAIVFFFGGGWTNGSPTQFEQHCKHLASRGMVAITADYRVASRNQVKAVELRARRQERDPLCAGRKRRSSASIPIALRPAADRPAGIWRQPAARSRVLTNRPKTPRSAACPMRMALFNPAVVLAEAPGLTSVNQEKVDSLKDRMGVEPKELSPYHQVKAGAPPTIIFHGKADTTVPYATVELFTKAMTDAGNKCTLMGYEGQAHGFFNYGRNGGEILSRRHLPPSTSFSSASATWQPAKACQVDDPVGDAGVFRFNAEARRRGDAKREQKECLFAVSSLRLRVFALNSIRSEMIEAVFDRRAIDAVFVAFVPTAYHCVRRDRRRCGSGEAVSGFAGVGMGIWL